MLEMVRLAIIGAAAEAGLGFRVMPPIPQIACFVQVFRPEAPEKVSHVLISASEIESADDAKIYDIGMQRITNMQRVFAGGYPLSQAA